MSNILEVIVAGNFGQLSKAMGGAKREIGAFEKSINVASIGAGIALAGLGVAAKIGFDEFSEGQQVAAQTNAVLKSTGGIAGVTAGQVDTLAGALMRKSGVDDEVIKTGENVLLGFTNIHNAAGKGPKIFDEATKAALDYSVRTGVDMPQAAKLFGKALNDPVKGLGALSKAGIKFTDAQKASMKAMVDSGNIAGAQQIVLKELETRYGGAAAAAGQTFAGKLNIAKESAKNLAGNLVGALVPALSGMVGVLAGATGWLAKHQTFTKILVGTVAALSAAILIVNVGMKIHAAYTVAAAAAKAIFTTQTAAATTGTAAQATAQHGLNLAMLANPIGLVVVAIVALAAAFIIAWKKSETFRDIVTGTWDAIKDTAKTVFDFVTETIPAAFEHVLDWIRSNWPAIATLISGPFAPLVALATDAFGIRSGLVGAMDAVKTKVGDIFRAIPGVIRGFLGDVGRAAIDLGERAVNGIANGLQGLVSKVKSFVNDIPGAIRDYLSEVGGAAVDLGERVVNGIGSGLASLARKLVGWIKTPINAVINSINFVTGKINSALEFEVDTHIPKVGKVGFDAPDIARIPTIGAGGIVTRPTLAWVAEAGKPEAVIPLDKPGLPSLGGGAGAVHNHFHFHGAVADRDAVVDWVRTGLVEAARRMPQPLGGLA